jgi:hypothetical protein
MWLRPSYRHYARRGEGVPGAGATGGVGVTGPGAGTDICALATVTPAARMVAVTKINRFILTPFNWCLPRQLPRTTPVPKRNVQTSSVSQEQNRTIWARKNVWLLSAKP